MKFEGSLDLTSQHSFQLLAIQFGSERLNEGSFPANPPPEIPKLQTNICCSTLYRCLENICWTLHASDCTQAIGNRAPRRWQDFGVSFFPGSKFRHNSSLSPLYVQPNSTGSRPRFPTASVWVAYHNSMNVVQCGDRNQITTQPNRPPLIFVVHCLSSHWVGLQVAGSITQIPALHRVQAQQRRSETPQSPCSILVP